MPHLRRQYPPDKFATFVVTDGIDKMRKYRAKRVCKYLAPTLMHDLPTRQSSQHAGLVLCSRLIEEHERKIKRRYDWVVRQRIDTLGCTPSPALASPVRPKTILVSYARCGWAADNWAWMSRDVLEVYVKGIVEQEAGTEAASIPPRRRRDPRTQVWATSCSSTRSRCGRQPSRRASGLSGRRENTRGSATRTSSRPA